MISFMPKNNAYCKQVQLLKQILKFEFSAPLKHLKRLLERLLGKIFYWRILECMSGKVNYKVGGFHFGTGRNFSLRWFYRPQMHSIFSIARLKNVAYSPL